MDSPQLKYWQDLKGRKHGLRGIARLLPAVLLTQAAAVQLLTVRYSTMH